MTSPSFDYWDANKILELYLHDYMMKRGMHNAAETFKQEAQIPNRPVYLVIESPDGFLHEWWSIFYDVFTSRPGKNQDFGSTSSSKVPMMTENVRNNALLTIPQISTSDQRIPEPIHSSFGNMMDQQASMSHPPHVGQLARNQVFKDKGISMHMERDSPKYPLDLNQKIKFPLMGHLEKKINEALNPMSFDGWPINEETMRMEIISYQQQCQMLQTLNQDRGFTQAIMATPKNQTFTIPEYSGKSNTLKMHEVKSRDKNKQVVINQTITTTERHQQNQQIQMQSHNAETSRKGKTIEFIRLGENAQNYEDTSDEKSKDGNVESYLSLENEYVDHEIALFNNLNRNSTTCRSEKKGFSFKEVGCLHSSNNKVLSSHFSSDGKVLASVGHERKVFIWNMETLEHVTTTETHSLLITDVRFRPGSTIFATSSFDKSVRLWDAGRPSQSLLKLTGHAEQVMSLDFHPRKVELLCSCDNNDVIQLWDVNQRVCMRITKGGSKQVRFQPCFGELLTTATRNTIRIVDTETNSLLYNLEGHTKDVISICWDRSGKYIASVSEDSARVWSLDGKCISELHSKGNKFQSCVFHPSYLNLLIIGGYQLMELWSPIYTSKTWIVPAHNGLITGLADSPENELVASASHDHCVKLWK